MSEKKRSRVIPFLGYAIPILLVVYVLSIGPAAAIVYDSSGKAHNPQHEKMAKRFYSPLVWLADQNEYIGYFFVTYIKFCRGTEIEE